MKKNDNKIPFGLKNGEITDISNVENGIKCECFCPQCGSQLIAKKGKKTQHHFAHYKKDACYGAYETAIHLMSKKILEYHKKIRLPAVILQLGSSRSEYHVLYQDIFIEFDSVEIEKRIENITPDILLVKNGKKLAIEIAVTHFVDDKKLKKIEELNISTLEVDLSAEIKFINENFLTEILINKIDHKMWIYNKKLNKLQSTINSYAKQLNIVQRGYASHVDNCPLKIRTWKEKAYANFIDDCHDCINFIGHKANIMYCTGEKIQELKDLLRNYINN